MRRRYHHASFVDDNATADIATWMRGAVRNSVLFAYYWFGFPDGDCRTPCLNALKWDPIAAANMVFLGFHICTRSMMVAWPVSKRLALPTLLDTHCQAQPCSLMVKVIATILGTVHNAAYVAPLGVFLSLRLQHALNGALKKRALSAAALLCWWSLHRLTLSVDVLEDLRLLRASLSSDPADPVWRQPIALLVNCIPMGCAKPPIKVCGVGVLPSCLCGALVGRTFWRVVFLWNPFAPPLASPLSLPLPACMLIS